MSVTKPRRRRLPEMTTRMPPDEKARVAETARVLGMNTTDYVRSVLAGRLPPITDPAVLEARLNDALAQRADEVARALSFALSELQARTHRQEVTAA